MLRASWRGCCETDWMEENFSPLSFAAQDHIHASTIAVIYAVILEKNPDEATSDLSERPAIGPERCRRERVVTLPVP